jgi:hypothetical protein
VFDRVATTGTVWLGLSIGCAQCHDHKFDPILQKEYYQFFAFFNNQEEPNLTLYEPGIDAVSLKDERRQTEAMQREIVKNADAGVSDWESHLESGQQDALPADIQKILQTEKSARTTPQNLALYAAGPGAADATFQMAQQRLQQIDKLLEANVTTMVMKELATPRKTTVFVQGDFTRPSDEVTCGTPAALHPLSRNVDAINRLDLAKWIVAPDNPLTSRVIVNRVWQQYFGRGLVETENDFGLQGSSPSHPELLDWLAVEFRDRGWSLKELHRVIVTSATYRQSSAVRADLQEKDPGNYLLARQLVERGVRFVQLYHTNRDHHGGPTENLEQHLPSVSKEIDQPCMALVRDLEQRGLLDDTIVIWGGEFGRTPMGEVRESTGRNHHIDAFTMWFAGGGFKPGVTFGETDEFGFGPVDRSVHVRDIHATLLHQMGISHERLTVRAQGLDFRLTGVLPARIVDEVLV